MTKLSPETKFAAAGALTGLLAIGSVAFTNWRADLSNTYDQWRTSLEPTVTCSKRGKPLLNLVIDAPINGAESFVVKVKSENGKAVEKDIPVSPSNVIQRGQFRDAVDVGNFTYQNGQKIVEPIQEGENLSITAFRLYSVYGEGGSTLIRAVKIAEKSITTVCPQP
jgi:hypothetical protein